MASRCEKNTIFLCKSSYPQETAQESNNHVWETPLSDQAGHASRVYKLGRGTKTMQREIEEAAEYIEETIIMEKAMEGRGM